MKTICNIPSNKAVTELCHIQGEWAIVCDGEIEEQMIKDINELPYNHFLKLIEYMYDVDASLCENPDVTYGYVMLKAREGRDLSDVF